MTLQIGDRVKLSREFRIAFPTSPATRAAYRGVVVKQMTRYVFKVQWDGVVTPEKLHVSYLELV